MGLAKDGIMATPIVCGATILCCAWIPLIFFFAAANVLPTCEIQYFDSVLKMYSVVPLLVMPLMHCITSIFAYYEWRFFFRVANYVVGCVGLFSMALQLY